MPRWSGLAKAVNAHLARWGKANGEAERMRMFMQRAEAQGDGEYSYEFDFSQYPITAAWMVFARTWGLPQADGSVVVPGRIQEGATINGREQYTQSEASAANGPMFAAKELRMLSQAETVYVSEEIVDRISYAASLIEPEPLFHTDMYAPSGLIVLEKPLLVPDYHPRTGEMTDYLHVGMRALGWAPEPVVWRQDGDGGITPGPGIMLFSYTTNTDWRESYEADLYRAIRQGKVDAEAIGWLSEDGVPIPEGEGRFSLSVGLPSDMFTPTDMMPWSFGKEWTFKDKAIYEPGVVDSAVAYVRRWFLTLMRFTWQRLIVPERPQFSKKLNRTVTEYRKPNLQWSVLRLRREVDRTEPTGTGTKLAYRQKVRGYWMNVHLKAMGPARLPDGTMDPNTHRLTWIEEGWRGPVDGPLGPLHKATVIVR